MINSVNCDKLKHLIRCAIKEFKTKDWLQLKKVQIYEPTISHRIAVYLEKRFPCYNIDCEYNKNLEEPKRNSHGQKIRPDIIIHKRRTNENLCVFEIKKAGINSQKSKEDIKKLRGIVDGHLGYPLGVFVGVLKSKIIVCWVEKGKGNYFEEL